MKLAALLIVMVAPLAACSSSEAPKQQTPQQGAATAPTGTNTNTSATGTTSIGDQQAAQMAIGLERADQTLLQFTAGAPINLAFRLTNATGKDVIVGLLTTPVGPTLTHNAGSIDVQFYWASPAVGSQKIRFILRDRAKCVAAETDATRCEIRPADFGVIGANSVYDTLSDEYSLEVAQGNGLGNGLGSILGNGGLSGLGAGNNSALISQITSLLQANGGAGAANTNNLNSLLSGLGNGQLQQILNSVKSGGSGANISSLLQMLQGLGLKGEE